MNVQTFIKNKNKYIWDILPETISFLRYIKSITDKNTIILFLARDCYFLEKLYSKMYQHDINYKYILCSRKVMYDSKNFDKYLEKITKGFDNRLWIDIQGSGNSHMEYFMKRNKALDKKLFLKKNDLTKKYSGINAKELQEEFRQLVATSEDTQRMYDASVSFVPIVGQVYHLYRRENGDEWISMIAPDDFGRYYHEYLGSYRLATDSVWERI